ncbi:MAG: hypothetical protein WDM70_09770 [Nitrosomonadales bacterium]
MSRAANNGVDVFRIFDAMNDMRNLRVSIEAVKKSGKHAEGCISYTTSPVHDIPQFVLLAGELEAFALRYCLHQGYGRTAHALCHFRIGQGVALCCQPPIHIHSHSTSGLSAMCFLKAVEAGATMLDTCNSSFGEGASHPSTESIVAALKDTPFDTGLDLSALQEITGLFHRGAQKIWQFESAFTGVDTRVLVNHVPGGMISNLSNQLKELDALRPHKRSVGRNSPRA